jgi:4-oxalocrotonate tautomerase
MLPPQGETTMPHVIVKLWPGKTEEQKQALTDEVAKAVIATLNCRAEAVSVGIEEVASQDWAEKVSKPDIAAKRDTIYRMPG